MLSSPHPAARREKGEVINPFRLKQEADTSTAFGSSPAKSHYSLDKCFYPNQYFLLHLYLCIIHFPLQTYWQGASSEYWCLSRPSNCVSIQRLKPSVAICTLVTSQLLQSMTRLLDFPKVGSYCHICSFLYPHILCTDDTSRVTDNGEIKAGGKSCQKKTTSEMIKCIHQFKSFCIFFLTSILADWKVNSTKHANQS